MQNKRYQKTKKYLFLDRRVSIETKLGYSRDRLKDLSLIFTGPYDGRPYERADFKTAIEETTGEAVSTSVLAWCPLTRNREWYCTVHSSTAKQALLARGTLSVKVRQFKVKSADKRQFTARVHWAPVFVTNADIVESLQFYSPEIKAIRHEMSTTPGFKKVASGFCIAPHCMGLAFDIVKDCLKVRSCAID